MRKAAGHNAGTENRITLLPCPPLLPFGPGGRWNMTDWKPISESYWVEPGRLLAVYYINLASDPVQVDGGVRHIAQTAFSPD